MMRSTACAGVMQAMRRYGRSRATSNRWRSPANAEIPPRSDRVFAPQTYRTSLQQNSYDGKAILELILCVGGNMPKLYGRKASRHLQKIHQYDTMRGAIKTPESFKAP